jgi:hypothetical protein
LPVLSEKKKTDNLQAEWIQGSGGERGIYCRRTTMRLSLNKIQVVLFETNPDF